MFKFKLNLFDQKGAAEANLLVIANNINPINPIQYAPSVPITTTTPITIAPVPANGLKNYLTCLQVKNTNATATEYVIKDGSTVIFRGHASASMVQTDVINFTTPLKASSDMTITAITTAANLYFNAQGYKAP